MLGKWLSCWTLPVQNEDVPLDLQPQATARGGTAACYPGPEEVETGKRAS